MTFDVGDNGVEASLQIVGGSVHIHVVANHGSEASVGLHAGGTNENQQLFATLHADTSGTCLRAELITCAHVLVIIPLGGIGVGFIVVETEFLFAVRPRIILHLEHHVGEHCREFFGSTRLTREFGGANLLELRFQLIVGERFVFVFQFGESEIVEELLEDVVVAGTVLVQKFSFHALSACGCQFRFIHLGRDEIPLRGGIVFIPAEEELRATIDVETYTTLVFDVV